MSVNEQLLDLTILHQVNLQHYSNATVFKIIALLNRIDADLVAKIHELDPNEVNGTWSARRLEKLLEAIRIINRDAYNQVDRELTAELKKLSTYEATFQVRAINAALPVMIDIVSPTAPALWAAVNSRPFQGRILKEWGRDLEAGAFAKVRDAIRQGYVEGETTDQIVRRIRGTRVRKFEDGILQTNRRNIETVVRTAVNHTATAARSELYRQNAGVLKGWRFVATLDARTTLLCASLDGTTYPLGEGPQPPRHFNCRSTSVPVVKSWKELGFNVKELPTSTRASMSGQVPATLTYNDWLKKQPVEIQNQVLGKARAELFREGGLALDRFVNDGRTLTLDELSKRESAAFAAAGLAA